MGYGDKIYTTGQEEKCDTWFRPWAKKWLEDAFRQGIYEIDWSGTTNGKNCVAELKDRSDLTSGQYVNCFIEADKIANLMFEWVYNGNEPLYFVKYNDKILCWNLRKLPSGIPVVKKVRAKNPELEKEINNTIHEKTGKNININLYTETQKGLLPIKDAIAYDTITMQRIK